VRQNLTPQVLLETRVPIFPGGWHPQKALLLLERFSEQAGNDIYLWADRGQPEPVLATPSSEGYVDLSRDGGWLAYTSDESGRPEIYVKRFPGQERGTRISTGGGSEPRWSHDGKRLFFWETGDAANPEGSRRTRLMVVDAQFEPSFRVTPPRELFQGRFVSAANAASTLYDASPVADRFVMLEPVEQRGGRRLNVVLNWTEELRRLVPAN